MKKAIDSLLALNALNVLTFAVIATVGIAHGVTEPFSRWFSDGSDGCFYAALLLLLVTLPFFMSAQVRVRALVSSSMAAGTAMVIAFLTTRG